MNGGILLEFAMGHFFGYVIGPLIGIGINLLFYILFIPVPDTPHYLLSANKQEAAEKSLEFYTLLKRPQLTEKLNQFRELQQNRDGDNKFKFSNLCK